MSGNYVIKLIGYKHKAGVTPKKEEVFMKKRLLAVLLACTMAISLCACGGGNTQTPDPTKAPATETTETAKPTEAPADPTPTPTPVPVEELKFTGSPT